MNKIKTNVMRTLEQRGIDYIPHEYPHGETAVDGLTAAALIGCDARRVFKTLVAQGASKKIYVFVIPVETELGLKKAAKAAGEKSIAMIKLSELTALTGYVRGGCSPIGMKKQYTSIYHESITELETVVVSAGKIGYQVELPPQDLIEITKGKIADITEVES